MNILDISIIIFIILEFSNVIILYYKPEFKYGNGVAVFKQWEKSKENDNEHLFAKYMTNWVAGVKFIFIAILVAILFTGNETTKFWSIITIIISITTYYFKLHPIIKKLDANDQIVPKGYSKTLFLMITGFLLMFSAALIVYLFQ